MFLRRVLQPPPTLSSFQLSKFLLLRRTSSKGQGGGGRGLRSISITLSPTGKSPFPLPGHFLRQKLRSNLLTLTGSSSFHRSSPPALLTSGGMAPTEPTPEDALKHVEGLISGNRVMLFSKTYCPFCERVKGLFNELNVDYYTLELDVLKHEEADLIQNALKIKSGQSTVPNVFVNGQHVGGCDSTFQLHAQNQLLPLIQGDEPAHDFEYDLIVIGGGSGGLAAAKEAAKFGKKVAVFDFVRPSPMGTSWGLGGTCVNVGCIPKKLMHQAALIGQTITDGRSFGWNVETKSHDWGALVTGVQEYIMSLNWGYRVSLRDKNVKYFNEYVEFTGPNTLTIVRTVDKKGIIREVSAQSFIVAVGGRPRYPNIPGAREFAITSDDVFSLPYNPGKTLCIGASYISLECAGFLAGLGYETTVMVRSILLRGFDQQMAELVGDYMKNHGIEFRRGWVPVSIEKIEDGTPPTLLVRSRETNGTATFEEVFNTVLIAVGRDPCTRDLHLENVGVNLDPGSEKIITNHADQSNVPHVYAIGDVAKGRPELTPVAIQAGVLLAKRLYGNSNVFTDYNNVATTVFTPLEYGCIGLAEEQAIQTYGQHDVDVYHSHFQALECALPKRDENSCYAKLVCIKSQKNRVVGFHYLGPNAGEVTQGFGIGIKLGATKDDFSSLIGIHPTCAEIFTTLGITKASGENAQKTGC